MGWREGPALKPSQPIGAPFIQLFSSAHPHARSVLSQQARGDDVDMKEAPIIPWPDHMRTIFSAIGAVLKSGRLYPENLLSLPCGRDALLQDHIVIVRHVPGKDLGQRNGVYLIDIDGPRYAGGWRFSSGELEALAKSAIQ